MPLKNVCVMPSEFRGVKPKLLVKKGDKVKIGSPLFYDKSKPDVKWASPGCGTIKDIVFGARRVIEKIEINLNGNDALMNNEYNSSEIVSLSKVEVLDNILTASPSKEGLLDNLTKFIPSSQFSNEMKKPSV